MDKFNKVLYLGAWDHIEVINYFPNCNEFILIDTKPRSEHDEKYYFYKGFYRELFIKIITKKCKKYGFNLDQIIELDTNYINKIKNIESNDNININSIPYINPHLLIFKNDSNRIIKYYISTNILFNMCPMLEKDIYEADSLYVAGYYPDCELLKYFLNKKKNFVGDNKTYYNKDYDDDYNHIININLDDYFDNYYLVWREKSMVIICDSLEDINNKIKKLKKNI